MHLPNATLVKGELPSLPVTVVPSVLVTVVHSSDRYGPWCALRRGEWHNGRRVISMMRIIDHRMAGMCTSLSHSMTGMLMYTPQNVGIPPCYSPFLRFSPPTNSLFLLNNGENRAPHRAITVVFITLLTFLTFPGFHENNTFLTVLAGTRRTLGFYRGFSTLFSVIHRYFRLFLGILVQTPPVSPRVPPFLAGTVKTVGFSLFYHY